MQDLLEKTDVETGEITLTEEEFVLLEHGKTPFVTPAGLAEYVDTMGDVITKKLEQAKRYREQAERRAKPLEKSANWLLQQLTPLLRELAATKLVKKSDGKTLHLASCSFSFTKVGGYAYAIDDDSIIAGWCKEMGMTQFVHEKVDKPALMTFLQKTNGLNEAPFIVHHKVDEFAKVKVKLD